MMSTNSENSPNSSPNQKANMSSISGHSFHIPVMGTGFTIDTPVRIARYGIDSVISIGDDYLMEMMREYHCKQSGHYFEPIAANEPDSRARRITAYLDLVGLLVEQQIEDLTQTPFTKGSEITRYYELLPDCPEKQLYLKMLAMPEGDTRLNAETELRKRVTSGAIDVNIMAKVDGNAYLKGRSTDTNPGPEQGVAMSGLRGFAHSRLKSSVVLSAGFNRRLFGYMATFDSFFPSIDCAPKKKIIVKVSDYRSALLQGRMLAKLGLWAYEFRIESGLNCGGHAFATKGELMGPILEEFKKNRETLTVQLRKTYQAAMTKLGRKSNYQPEICITAQGGIGTGDEHQFLLSHYDLDSAGWGTPFLLVPEVSNVDDKHLKLLAAASLNEVSLSGNSPLGIPIWDLNTSDAEQSRLVQVAEGKYGSPCPKGFLKSDTEFTKSPICPASRAYQKLKTKQLQEDHDTSPDQIKKELERIQKKTCLCLNLTASTLRKNELSDEFLPSICCGPGIVDYNRTYSLEEMVNHIYDRQRLPLSDDRPHVFNTELRLYIEYLRQEMVKNSADLAGKTLQFLTEFKENLSQGIAYYRNLASELSASEQQKFIDTLDAFMEDLEAMILPPVAVTTGSS